MHVVRVVACIEMHAVSMASPFVCAHVFVCIEMQKETKGANVFMGIEMHVARVACVTLPVRFVYFPMAGVISWVTDGAGCVWYQRSSP